MTDSVAHNPFLARLVEHWTEVHEALDEVDRRELADLLTGSDPAQVRQARIIRLLMLELPRGHPARRAIFGSDTVVKYATTAQIDIASLETLSRLASGTSLLRETVESPLPQEATEPVEPSWRRLHRRLRRRLADVPWLSPEEVPGTEQGQPLVRLRYGPDRVQLPAFQFGPDRRVRPAVAEVNRLLRAERDPWGVASWWTSRHAWLLEPPADLLGVQDQLIVEAARAVVEG
jgi:hypothetical protein